MKLISDDKGNVSSMRVVVIVTAVMFAVQWVVSLVTTGTFAPSWELVSFVSAAVLGKAAQKFSENGE